MNSTRVDELVSAWRDARARGASATVAELCRDSPELAPAVAKRIAALGSLPAASSGTVTFAPPETSLNGDLPALPVGPLPTSLGGYRVEGILGQGGMGTVYLAHDDRLGRAVALKAMKPEIAAQSGARDRFLREARAVAGIEHDNIIPIWQVGEDAGIPFIAMPLLHGESLADRLQRERMAPLGVILKVGREVAEGLAAAHAHGLVHRDVKPANVWLEGDLKAADPNARFRRCKLLDFGLARPANDDAHLTASGAVIGTPAYMSPEQAAGLPVDFRTDLFSLGVLLYRMATGEQPFTGPSIMAVLTSLAVHNPPPATTKNPSLPAPLSELIMKLMTKDHTGRPGSAREVADALREMTRQLAAARKAGSAGPAPLPTVTLPLARPVIRYTTPVPANNPFTGIDTEAAAPPPPPATAPASGKTRLGGTWKWVAAALFAAVAIVVAAGVVIIKVTGPDGKVTTIEAPVGSKVAVDPKGRVQVELPKNPKAQPKPVATDKAVPKPVADDKPTPKPVATDKALPKPVATELDRRVAEWALGCGGKVQIKVNNAERPVAAAKDLPVAPFLLIRVILDECGDKVTDAGLERLEGLTGITHLYLSKTSVTGAGLEHVKELGTLVDVRLGNTKMTDAGLECLKGMKGLTHLTVFNTEVTDAGLEHLRGLDQLQDLDLNGTKITGAGLKHLKGMTRLGVLGLYGTGVTDAGLDELRGLTALTKLELDVTDAGLAKLKAFPALSHLGVSGPQLTDAGLEHLKGMTKLTHLGVSGPLVTDAGLEHLKGLTKLAELGLTLPKVTPAGVERLRKALPNCKIVRY